VADILENEDKVIIKIANGIIARDENEIRARQNLTQIYQIITILRPPNWKNPRVKANGMARG
jgi:hypothetical protein